MISRANTSGATVNMDALGVTGRRSKGIGAYGGRSTSEHGYFNFRNWDRMTKCNDESNPSVTSLLFYGIMHLRFSNSSPDIIVGYGLLFDTLLDYHLLTIFSTSQRKFTEVTIPAIPTRPPNFPRPLRCDPAEIRNQQHILHIPLNFWCFYHLS